MRHATSILPHFIITALAAGAALTQTCSQPPWTDIAGHGLRPIRRHVILHGSAGCSHGPGDAWTWDGVAWEQIAQDSPLGRSACAPFDERRRSSKAAN